MGETGELCVLVDLGLPAIGHRGGQTRAGDHRNRAVQATGDRLGQGVLVGVGSPLGYELLGVRGGDVDL